MRFTITPIFALLLAMFVAAVVFCNFTDRVPHKEVDAMDQEHVFDAQYGSTSTIRCGVPALSTKVTQIYWRGTRSSGANPLAVLKATARQMEREQGTPLGSDQNARALALTLQAIAALEGKQTETADGTPIIQ